MNRPVEKVSWDDVQVFIEQINARISGLALVLPSEAQWEYACRAGTTTPFSFGRNVTPELVNYNGEYPYADGEMGLYRGETIPVKSLPPNDWGLHEMHGNVWEWVQDTWHESYKGAPVDGSAWQRETIGEERVLRGGSWLDYGRVVRSARRIHFSPVIRSVGIGFRLARGQEPETGKQEAERARPLPPGPRSGSGRAAAGSSRAVQGLPGKADTGQQPEPQPQLLRLDTAAEAEALLPSAPAFRIVTDRERLTIRQTKSRSGPAPSAATASVCGRRSLSSPAQRRSR